MAYDYRDVMCNDIREYIEDNGIDVTACYNTDELEEKLNEVLWAGDSVTGNGSGSYFFNVLKAQAAVEDNMLLYEDACREFGVSAADIGELFLNGDYETMDVTIRCYLLSECISKVVEEIREEDD